MERRPLSRGAWVDVNRDWLPRADEIFATLVEQVPWRAERREMYDRVVDVPRLVCTYLAGGDAAASRARRRARRAERALSAELGDRS